MYSRIEATPFGGARRLTTEAFSTRMTLPGDKK
jgi:hypothetical protein